MRAGKNIKLKDSLYTSGRSLSTIHIHPLNFKIVISQPVTLRYQTSSPAAQALHQGTKVPAKYQINKPLLRIRFILIRILIRNLFREITVPDPPAPDKLNGVNMGVKFSINIIEQDFTNVYKILRSIIWMK